MVKLVINLFFPFTADSFTATDDSWNWPALDSGLQDNGKQPEPLFPTMGDLKSKPKKLETPQWSTESQPSLESSDDVLPTSESDKSHLMSRCVKPCLYWDQLVHICVQVVYYKSFAHFRARALTLKPSGGIGSFGKQREFETKRAWKQAGSTTSDCWHYSAFIGSASRYVVLTSQALTGYSKTTNTQTFSIQGDSKLTLILLRGYSGTLGECQENNIKTLSKACRRY